MTMFDMDKTVVAARDALKAGNHVRVGQLYSEAESSDGPMSPSLLRISLRAILAEKGISSAWQVFEQRVDCLRVDQRRNLLELLSLDVAAHAMKENSAHDIITRLSPIKHWLKPDRVMQAMRFRVFAELTLGRPERAAQAVIKTLSPIEDSRVEDALNHAFRAADSVVRSVTRSSNPGGALAREQTSAQIGLSYPPNFGH